MREATTLLLVLMITMQLVTATNTVKMQRRTDKMQENSAKVFCDKLTCQSAHAIKLNS